MTAALLHRSEMRWREPNNVYRGRGTTVRRVRELDVDSMSAFRVAQRPIAPLNDKVCRNTNRPSGPDFWSRLPGLRTQTASEYGAHWCPPALPWGERCLGRLGGSPIDQRA
jgi:hypothetical protein